MPGRNPPTLAATTTVSFGSLSAIWVTRAAKIASSVTRPLASESLSWYSISSVDSSGETPETTHPALRVPSQAMTYSGMLGRLMPTTSPFFSPARMSMSAKRLDNASSSLNVISVPMKASAILSGNLSKAGLTASTKLTSNSFGSRSSSPLSHDFLQICSLVAIEFLPLVRINRR